MSSTDTSFQHTHPILKLMTSRRPTRKQVQRYNEALGAFISNFTATECWIVEELWALAGVEEPIAQALLSGTRVDAAMSLIKRVMDAKKIKGREREVLEWIIEQLRIINKVRNDVVHFGSHQTPGEFYIVTNIGRAHVEPAVRVTTISPKMLDAMSWDLVKISTVLSTKLLNRYRDQFPAKLLPGLDTLCGIAERFSLTSWHYTPQELPPPRRRSQKTRAKPAPPTS